MGKNKKKLPSYQEEKLVKEFEPKTERQAEFIELIESKEVVICKGIAGSGKSYIALGKALQLLGKSFTISRSPPNPGIRNSHHIPHYTISRTLYIPLQTNALCDALSDWQCIVMFYPQLIG